MEKLQIWIDRDIPRSKTDVVVFSTVDGYDEYTFYIYTDNYRYCIYAHNRGECGYLGCTYQNRRYRPGEDWFRGNDLPDGPLTEQTWYNIMVAIVRNELKDVVKKF